MNASLGAEKPSLRVVRLVRLRAKTAHFPISTFGVCDCQPARSWAGPPAPPASAEQRVVPP